MYLSFDSGVLSSGIDVITRLEACIVDIHQWMLVNRLKLNNDKMEFLKFLPQFQTEPITSDSLQIGNELIGTSTKATNLGVIIDPNPGLSSHITVTCRAATYQLYCLSRIKCYLSSDALKMAVHILISSKLDNCNSLFSGLPKHDIQKSQHIMNSAARLISSTWKHDHITPVLISLHWLPVRDRITYKALHGFTPPYLTD